MGQRGFVSLFIILGILIILGGIIGGAFYLRKGRPVNNEQTGETSSKSTSATPASNSKPSSNSNANLVANSIILVKKQQLVAINLLKTSDTKIVYEIKDGNFVSVKWSPDRKELAYLKQVIPSDQRCDIHQCAFELGVINSDDHSSTALFTQPSNVYSSEFDYFWSSDSSNLIYAFNKEVWKVNTQTTNRSLIKKTDSSGVQVVKDNVYFHEGKNLKKFSIQNPEKMEEVFNNDNPNGITCGTASPNEKIFICSANDTTGSAYLWREGSTNFKKFGAYPCAGFYFASFTSDSNYFAISSGCGESGQTEIFDSSGNKFTSYPNDEMARLTGTLPDSKGFQANGFLTGTMLSFSPDGKKVFLVSSILNSSSNPPSMFTIGPYGFISDINGTNLAKVDIPEGSVKRDISNTKDTVNSVEW